MSSTANDRPMNSPTAVPDDSASAEGASDGAGHNPPPKSVSALRPARSRLQYFAAFRYLFNNPEWPQSLALGSICYLIPVFGQVALLGYYYEIIERLHRDPQSPCPTFNLRRFAVYSARGVWSYLLILAVSSLLQLIVQVPLQYTMFGILIAFQSSSTTGTIVATISAVVWLLVFSAIFLMMIYVVQPLMLRGGLSQELGWMFQARWVAQYSKRVWLEILLVQAVLFMAMCLLLPLGMLMFCIGVLPVSMWLAIAGSHLNWQVYEVALQRGCQAVPLKPQAADEPPPYIPTPSTAPVPPGKADYPASPSSSASP